VQYGMTTVLTILGDLSKKVPVKSEVRDEVPVKLRGDLRNESIKFYNLTNWLAGI
jgi:hypothetical protein